jgi:integrase/recombinase XerC/integrase/recombinase XerD
VEEALLREFLLDLEVAGRSEATRRLYERFLTRLAGYLRERGATLTTAAPSHLREFLALHRHYMPASRRAIYAALHRFYAWLVAQGEIERSPAAGLPRPDVPERIVPVLTDEQVRRVLSLPLLSPRDPLGARNRALFLTLLDTGLRRTEALGMTLSPDGRYDIVRVVGKRNRERLLALSPSTQRAILRYVRLWRLTGSGPLWRGKDGRPLTASGLQEIFRRISHAAGFRVWPHLLRHTWATAMRDAGADAEAVQTLGGWASADMLRHYTRSRQALRALEIHRRYSPVERMGLG